MRWLDGITDSMDTLEHSLGDSVTWRAWHAAVHGAAELDTTEQLNNKNNSKGMSQDTCYDKDESLNNYSEGSKPDRKLNTYKVPFINILENANLSLRARNRGDELQRVTGNIGEVMEIFIRTEPSAREKAHTNCCVLEGNTVSPSFHTQIPAPVGRQSLDFLVLRFKVSSLVLHQEGPVELRKTGKTGLTRSHSHRFWVSFPDNVLAPKK